MLTGTGKTDLAERNTIPIMSVSIVIVPHCQFVPAFVPMLPQHFFRVETPTEDEILSIVFAPYN